MNDTVIVAAISGVLSLIGVIVTSVVTVVVSSRKSDQRLEKAQIESNNRLEKAQNASAANLEKAQIAAEARLEKSQAITTTKIEELTREVREHNNFARRVPVIEEQIRVINHRLQDLEDDV